MDGLPKRTPTLIGLEAFHTVPADEAATPVKLVHPPPPRRREEPILPVAEEDPDQRHDAERPGSQLAAAG